MSLDVTVAVFVAGINECESENRAEDPVGSVPAA
jgi:hypothetical protein